MAKVTIEADYRSVVPPEKAKQWFWDYTEQDHSDPRFLALWGQPKAGDGRKMVSKGRDQTVFEDTFSGRTTKFVTRPEGDAIVSKGDGPGWKSEGRLSFAPEGQGSKIHEKLDLDAPGLGGFFMKLMGIPAKIEKDVGIHVQMMEEEWKRKPW
jgi:hypothetical protein